MITHENIWVSKLAQLLPALALKCDNLSSQLLTHVLEGKTSFPKLSSDSGMYPLPKINKWKIKFKNINVC